MGRRRSFEEDKFQRRVVAVDGEVQRRKQSFVFVLSFILANKQAVDEDVLVKPRKEVAAWRGM